MPDSVEIPAPVKTVIRSAPSIQPRTSSMEFVAMGWGLRAKCVLR